MTTRKKLLSLFGVAMVILLSSVFFFIRAHASVESEVRAILADCNVEDKDHAPCYESEVPKLYPKFSVAEIFKVIQEVRTEDATYQFCHVLAHKVGERVVAEDPDKWVEAISLNPSDGFCSNGFMHGVIGGRFRAEVLDESTVREFLPDFKRACEPHDVWHPTDLDKAICYHGIGHLYDFITNADLGRALDLCAQTTPDQFRRVCVEGVFMQIYQPLEPDDFALIEQMKVKPTKKTLTQFCASFKEPEFVGACLRESWPMHEGMIDGTGAADYCAGQPNTDLEDYCYQAAFTIIGRQLLARPHDAAQACDVIPSERRAFCYAVVANSILEENRMDAAGAVAFCERGGTRVSDPCFSFLLQTAPFNFGSNAKQRANFCAAFPETHQSRCRVSVSNPGAYAQ